MSTTQPAKAFASARPRKKTSYHHGDLRQAVLLSGAELLEEHGAAGLSLRAVARSLGVSSTAPLHHFPTKQDLLVALAALGFTRIAELEKKVCSVHRAPVRRLRALAAIYFHSACARPELFRLMTGTDLNDAESASDLEEARSLAFSFMQQGIAEFLAERCTPAAPWRANAAVWSMVHGFTSLVVDRQIRPGEGGAPSAEKMLSALVDDVLRGLAR